MGITFIIVGVLLVIAAVISPINIFVVGGIGLIWIIAGIILVIQKRVTCHSKYKFAGLNARQDTQVVYLDDYYVQIQGEKLLKV